MPRHGATENALSRQRTLFGVDMVERQLADLSAMVFQLMSTVSELLPTDVARATLCDTVHAHRASGWLIQYTERQRSDFEFGGPDGP